MCNGENLNMLMLEQKVKQEKADTGKEKNI